MAFPLVDRELTLRARNKWMYALRMIMGSITCAFIMLYLMISGFGRDVVAETIGRGLVGIAATFQFSAALLLPPFLGASLIAREKQERTLGLLMLADMRGADVYFAKLLSAFLPAATLIAGTLPVLAFAAIFGGITVETIATQVGLFMVTAMAAASLTLFCSTVSKNTGTAMIASVILIGISLSLQPAAEILLEGQTGLDSIELHPAFAAMQLSKPGLPSWYWVPGAAVGLGVTLVCMALTIPLLPRQVFQKPVSRRGAGARRRARRRRSADRNPTARILALGAPGFSSSMFTSIVLKAIASLLFAVVAFVPCVGIIFVAALAAYDVLTSMDVARRSGVMDDIRLTAPSPKALVQDIFRSQYRRCLFYLPAFTVGGGSGSSMFFGIVGAGFLGPQGASTVLDWLGIAASLVSIVVVGLCQVYLIVGVACFESRVRANPGGRAIVCALHYFGWMMLSGVAIYLAMILWFGSTLAFDRAAGAIFALIEPILPFVMAIGSATVFGAYYFFFGHLYRRAFERAYEKFV